MDPWDVGIPIPSFFVCNLADLQRPAYTGNNEERFGTQMQDYCNMYVRSFCVHVETVLGRKRQGPGPILPLRRIVNLDVPTSLYNSGGHPRS